MVVVAAMTPTRALHRLLLAFARSVVCRAAPHVEHDGAWGERSTLDNTLRNIATEYTELRSVSELNVNFRK